MKYEEASSYPSIWSKLSLQEKGTLAYPTSVPTPSASTESPPASAASSGPVKSDAASAPKALEEARVILIDAMSLYKDQFRVLLVESKNPVGAKGDKPAEPPVEDTQTIFVSLKYDVPKDQPDSKYCVV